MSHSIAEIRARNPMWIYEHNYVAMLELLHRLECDGEEEIAFEIEDCELNIRVMERCRYTILVAITQTFKKDSQLFPDLTMRVRVYHDARLVEVVAYQDLHRLLPKYTYPNKRMLQRDEKRQANLLLYEWLTIYLREARSVVYAVNSAPS